MTTKAGSKARDLDGEIKICQTCKIPFSDIYEYAEHLESKQHMKGVMKKKYAEKYLAAKAKLEAKEVDEETKTPDKTLSYSKESSKPVKEVAKVEKEVKVPVSPSAEDSSSSNDNSDEDEVYTCQLCEKVCTGLSSYQLHLQGKKHLKTERKVKLLKEMKEQKLIPEIKEEPKEEDSLFAIMYPESRQVYPHLDCRVCKKKHMGPEAYRQHCKSESHKKKVALDELIKGSEIESMFATKDQDEDGAAFAHCDVCNKQFSGPLPYMQHMKSASHLKLEVRAKALGKIQDLIINNEVDSKFDCKECGKNFSGPVPYNAHLKSSAHDKMKKKSALMENLEKKHPELIKTQTVENSDDSDEDSILGCAVCSVSFSGPVSAYDHFTSPKHKKAVKKKAMFKKFKQQQKEGKLQKSSKKLKESESDDSSEFEEEFDIINEP